MLDDKRADVQALLQDAPLPPDHLCDACREHFSRVQHALTALGVRFSLNPRLVRGLDYYTRTTFEFDHPALGAQSGIGGGGRYDGLMESLGGPDMTGIGFGLGTDRTLLACQAEGLEPGSGRRVVASSSSRWARPRGMRRRSSRGACARPGFRSTWPMAVAGLKGAMKAADRSGARWAIIMGEKELAEGQVGVKDLENGSQLSIAADEIVGHVLTGE